MLGLVIDWQAISAIVGGLVFLATLALAISTWKMARAGRDQARAAEDQAEAARAQADASAQLADIARRQLAVSSSAAIRVVRDGPNASVSRPVISSYDDEPLWSLVLHNSGEAPAMTERATLHLPGGLGSRSGTLGVDPVLKPFERRSLSFPLGPDEAEQAAADGGEWTVTAPYREPGSTEVRRFRAALKAKREHKAGGWRWIVLREETK